MPGVVALHLPQSHSWDQAEEPTQFQIQSRVKLSTQFQSAGKGIQKSDAVQQYYCFGLDLDKRNSVKLFFFLQHRVPSITLSRSFIAFSCRPLLARITALVFRAREI